MTRDETPRDPPREDGHDHGPDCECLPIRVVVDQHGHYWRDYGDHWSMCPVSDENVATEPVTEFYRLGEGGDFEAASSTQDALDVEALAGAIATAADNSWPTPRVYSGDQTEFAGMVATEYAAIRAARGQQ